MNKFFSKLVLMLMLFSLAACSGLPSQKKGTAVQHSQLLQATGYSQVRSLAYLTAIQNKFAVEQTATINAYRALAKQLYQLRLNNGKSVAEQVVKQDDFRVYMDLFLREAKLESSSSVAGRKKVLLGLTVTPRFFYCMSNQQRVKACLLEDDKVPFTRLGYQAAKTTTVNLACIDCVTQLSIAGFTDRRNRFDKTMLDFGLYDAEWLGNMAASAVIRYWYLTQLIFN